MKKKYLKKQLRGIVLNLDDEASSEFEYVFSFFDKKKKKTLAACYNDISDMRYDGWSEDSITSLLLLEKHKYDKYFY